jgi:hypothetical protein
MCGPQPRHASLIGNWPCAAAPASLRPISTRVNKPENDDPSVVEPVELNAATA